MLPRSMHVAALAEQALDSESIVVRINNSRCFCWSVMNSQTNLAAGQQLEQRQATLYENAYEMHVPPGTVRTASPSDGRWSATRRSATCSSRSGADLVPRREIAPLPVHCSAARTSFYENVACLENFQTFSCA